LGTLKTDDAKSVVAFRISWSTTRVGANPIVSQSQAAAATAAHPSLAPLLLAACTSDPTANSFNGQPVSHQDSRITSRHKKSSLTFSQSIAFSPAYEYE
jgi:hypothetical protein